MKDGSRVWRDRCPVCDKPGVATGDMVSMLHL